jgi:hypothetical protein
MTGTIPFVPSAIYSEPASSYGFSQFSPAFVGRAARPRATTLPANAMLEHLAFAKTRQSWWPSACFRLAASALRAGVTGSAGRADAVA